MVWAEPASQRCSVCMRCSTVWHLGFGLVFVSWQHTHGNEKSGWLASGCQKCGELLCEAELQQQDNATGHKFLLQVRMHAWNERSGPCILVPSDALLSKIWWITVLFMAVPILSPLDLRALDHLPSFLRTIPPFLSLGNLCSFCPEQEGPQLGKRRNVFFQEFKTEKYLARVFCEISFGNMIVQK